MAKTILIVEDNESNMRLFDDLLQAHGYQTIKSIDGKKVPELANEHHPDLIIMDIQLPHRSGLEITKDLKADENIKHIPVVAVTAFELEGGVERILAAGCDDVLGKPISVPAFLEMVEKYLT